MDNQGPLQLTNQATEAMARATTSSAGRYLLVLLLGLGLPALPAAAADVVIDTFADPQALLDAPPTDQSFVDEAADNMIGTERDLQVAQLPSTVLAKDKTAGGLVVSAEVTGGALSIGFPGGTRGEVQVVWDGNDDTMALDPVGLGGVDLTDGGLDSGLRLLFSAVTGAVEVTVEVHTDGNFASRGVALVTAAGDLVLSQSSFEAIGFLGGADFASVGAVVVRLAGTAATATLGQVSAVPPGLSAVKDDLNPLTDVGLGNTPVAPGATVRYRITITNTGAEALDVDLNDMIDSNTTLSGAVHSTPIAGPDGYSTILDTMLSISDPALGLLSNDTDPDPEVGTLTVSMADTQSIQSAVPNVAVNNDGTFDYMPPAGFLGVDSFGYTLSDGDAAAATAAGRVTLLVLNAAPVLAPGSFDVAFTEDAGAVAIAPTITVADANDASLASATVTLTNLVDSGEEILAAATGGTSIVAAYTPPTLTLTGPDTLANFQTVLQSVTYENTSDDPTESPDRDLQIVANDGTGDSNTAISTVSITAVNDPPMLTVGGTLGFTEADPATVINGSLTLTDPDGPNITGGTVAITSGLDNSEDLLAATDMLGITSSYTAATGVLTLTGVTSAASYQAVLRTVTYQNTDLVDPTNTSRTVTFTVSDGIAAPVADTATVTVADDNEPPMATGDSYTTVGHVELTAGGAVPTSLARVVSATNILSNDADGEEGSALTVVGLNGTLGVPPLTGDSTLAPMGDGNVTLAADGSFVYLPPVGVRGMVDTFTYSVSDGTDTATATVSITIVDELVWFVHNDAAGEILNPVGGDGRSSDPFDKLSDADAVLDDPEDASSVDEHIFIFEGDGTTANQNLGITLKTDQILLGHAATTTTIGGVVIQTPNPPASTGLPASDRPVIGHGAGVGVTVTDVTGVEIRNLEIDTTGGHPIHISSTGGNDVGATVDNTVGASAMAALRVQQDSTGTTTLTVTNNEFVSDADGALITSSAGVLDLIYNNNVHETAAGASGGLLIDGSAGGSLRILQFAGNTVSIDNVGLGILVDTAVFDSDFGTAGFQTVLGGATAIGAVGGGNEIVGAGLALRNVRGALDFDQLDIFNSGGTGFELANPALMVGDFSLTIDAGTVVTSGGLALDMDPATVATTFTNVNTSGSGAGVSLVDLAGTVTIQAGAITSADTTTAFHVSGGTATIDYAGTIDNSAGRSVVVQNRPLGAGTVTFSGVIGNLAANSGTGILVTANAAGSVAFSGGLNLATGNNDAVTLTSNTGSAVSFTGGFDLDTTTGTGFVASGGGVISANTGTNTIDTSTGSAILVDGTTLDATFTDVNVTAGTVTAVGFLNSPGIKVFNDLDLVADLGGGGLLAPPAGGTAKSAAPGSTVFFASNGGTLGLQGGGNTLDATGGTGICWINTNLVVGTNGFTSLVVDDTGESNPGLIFDGIGGGSLQTPVTVSGVGNPDFSANGIEIRSSTSSFVFANTSSISGVSATAFLVGAGAAGSGGANPITYLGTITNTRLLSVHVQRRSGGEVTFGGLIDDTGNGIFLDSFSGGTTTFRGGLDLDTFDDIALRAVSAGTLNVCATIDCAAGAAVNNDIGGDSPIETTAVSIDNTTIGASHVTFRSISVDQASPITDETGIFLRNTGSTGDFRVTGDGSTSPLGSFGGNGSGGTLENFLDVDAVTLDTVGGRVHLQNMIVEDIGDSGDGGDAIGTRSARDGIHAENLTGGLSLDSVTIRRISDNAVNGALFADGISATSFTGLEIRNSLLENTNRFHVAGRGDAADEAMVRIVGLTGTVRVDNSHFRLGAGALDLKSPAGAGTLDILVQRSRFEDLYKEFASGGTLNVGRRGLDITANGSHNAVVRIGDPAEADPALGNLFVNNFTASVVVLGQEGGMSPHTGDIDVVISRNTFRITDHTTPQAPPGNLQFNFPQGGVALVPAGGTFDAIVSNNLFDEVMHAAGGLGQLTLGLNGGVVQAIVRGNTFRLPWDGPVQIRADGTASAAVLFENNTYIDGLVGGPADDVGFATQSPFNPFLVNVLAGGSLDLTVRNEDLPQHDIVFTPADRRHSIEVEVQADSAANEINLHLLNNTGPEGYHLKQFNGTFNLFRGASASSVPATIVDDNGNTGGASNPATDPPAVPTTGTITAVGTAPTLPVVVIP